MAHIYGFLGCKLSVTDAIKCSLNLHIVHCCIEFMVKMHSDEPSIPLRALCGSVEHQHVSIYHHS